MEPLKPTEVVSRQEFEIEMIRRERGLIPVLRDFSRYVLTKNAVAEDYRRAAVEAMLWSFFSPGGAGATAGVAVVALLTVFLSGWAAWETRRGALETAKATRASVWLQVLAEYADPQMLASMKGLRQWQRSDPARFTEKFEDLLLQRDKTVDNTKVADELDSHRRRAVSFFNKLRVLAEGALKIPKAPRVQRVLPLCTRGI